jgi:hypothetical protein
MTLETTLPTLVSARGPATATVLAALRPAQAGTLDTTFGDGGNGAIAQVDKGDYGAAGNKIMAFMNEANALVSGNVPTAAQGQDHCDRAAAIVSLPTQ